MSDQMMKDMMQRAARNHPGCKRLGLYCAAEERPEGSTGFIRPSGRFDWIEDADGGVFWKEAEGRGIEGFSVGEGKCLVIGANVGNVDLIDAGEGEWLAVIGVLGEDVFGASVYYKVKRLKEPPEIRNAAP